MAAASLFLLIERAGAQLTSASVGGHGSSGGSDAVVPPEKSNPIRIPRFETAPVIDGKLDEGTWKSAAVFKDFYQVQPGDNTRPSQLTEVYMGYDSKFLYIAFRAYDEPGKVRANVPKRDEIFDDDNVRVVLDTFNDQRKGYALAFNPLGVQADAIFTDGVNEDFSVDIVMESKGQVTEDGYVVEVAVPFKSLRYRAGKDTLWGVNFYRRIKRLNNESNSWMPISRDRSGLLSQFGHITGLEGIASEHTLEIIPSITISEVGKRIPTLPLSARLNDPGRFLNRPATVDPGVSVKLGLSSTLTLDFTANPDFAQVEADQPVITANQRFPIFFPEKRPFFLEGIDIFQTPLQAVHTRAIIDPDYAVKLTGKQGRNSFGVLLASDNAPGNFGEEERTDPNIIQSIARFVDKNAYIGVARFKRDVGKESSLGAIATSYNFIEKHNQLAGVDGRLRIDQQTVLTFQAVGSVSRRFFFDPDQGRQTYRTGEGFGYFLHYGKNTRNYGYSFFGQGRTRDYRADVGFTRRTNTNFESIGFRYNTDPRTSGAFIGLNLFTNAGGNFDWQGRMQNWNNHTELSLTFARQTFLNVGFDAGYERVFEEEFGAKRTATNPGSFFGGPERSTRGGDLFAVVGTTPSRKYSGFAFVGRRFNAFDFDFGAGPRFPRVSPAALADPSAPLDPGPGAAWDLSLQFSYQPTQALRASLDFNKTRLVRNDTGRLAFEDDVFSLKTTYQFTRFTFLRARLDYDTLASRVQGQYLLGWTPNPGTSFYVGYNDDMNYRGFNPFTGQRGVGFQRNSRTFFVKTSYLFRRSI